ncbi:MULTISPECIES: type II toxin-antitoxin system death-on-curing family toxin [Novosphingobium]|uniref:Type II toxin-antitoxin system death-on-curing family toxin n=1 Tax=Novosphingobium decolorationis TaxID=2698673 RepID=A0ABX8E4Q1_9SPHN|nr:MULTISPECIES: type II toxin-antitoxin system death-on-curing family toxin [Novosphingobium]MED5546223.1 type II toxin-antitoxin system death-on-curing family toxin [Pseudomonadota bacterium]QVM84165.1 type II toxin-antitoxin system death-on-curing family toxin [Novosphingobium decolorationis]GAM04970.1 death on curing toxin protein doc [Novosphingobium sp. MBES04]
MSEPYWIDADQVVEIHEEQIELYGGPHGVRDLTLVESAVDRPRTLYHYEGEEDVLVLGVRLGLSIADNHGFIDGNKRAGAFAMLEFFAINGYGLDMPNDETLGQLFKAAVTGDIRESDLVAELDQYLVETAED